MQTTSPVTSPRAYYAVKLAHGRKQAEIMLSATRESLFDFMRMIAFMPKPIAE